MTTNKTRKSFTEKRQEHLENALARTISLINETGNNKISVRDLQKRMTAWRKNGAKLWLLDKGREHGLDFTVEKLTPKGEPYITLTLRQ